MNLQVLKEDCDACKKCKLHKNATQKVFSSGDPHAAIMIVGEAPGEEEDQSGIPFVGKSGKLLNVWLKKYTGLERDVFYICNVLKCRPPNNQFDKVCGNICSKRYLRKQIRLVDPLIILAVGKQAAESLLKRDVYITRESGKLFHLHSSFNKPGVTVFPIFHPAYVLRNPNEEERVSNDLGEFCKLINRKTK